MHSSRVTHCLFQLFSNSLSIPIFYTFNFQISVLAYYYESSLHVLFSFAFNKRESLLCNGYTLDFSQLNELLVIFAK